MTVEQVFLAAMVAMALIVGGLVSYALHIPLPIGGI